MNTQHLDSHPSGFAPTRDGKRCSTCTEPIAYCPKHAQHYHLDQYADETCPAARNVRLRQQQRADRNTTS